MEKKEFINRFIQTPSGEVPVVSTELTFKDRVGAFRVRWGIGRNNYRVDPGLYAVGEPDSSSPVLVTANYKLTFDKLRSELKEISAWILVIDTEGINVWCSAGKGKFCNSEILKQVEKTGLKQVVNHGTLILPQLSAPGVSAFELKRQTGFRAVYGPVRARDIRKFLAEGLRATEEMRRVIFPLKERITLVPVELVNALKFLIPITLIIFILSTISPGGIHFERLKTEGILSLGLFLSGFLGGVLVTPVFLPLIPGRAFSLKGLFVGIFLSLLWGTVILSFPTPFLTRMSGTGWAFIIPAISSFTAMNFTGATTFTSLSGVTFEMRRYIPVQATLLFLGLALWVGGKFLT